MAITGLPNPMTKHPRVAYFGRRPWLAGIGLMLLAAFMAGVYFAGEHWPYRYREIKPLLEDVFGSQVIITRYHRTYFPHPGFMATGITLRRKSAPDQPPIGSVQTLYVQGSWIDMLRLKRSVRLVAMTGVHVVLPPPGSRAAQEDFPPGSSSDFTGPDTAIGRLEIHDSLLDVLRADGGRFSFPIAQLRFDDVQKGRTTTFTVDMENAIPTGHIHASGRFGPLLAHSLGDTLVSGQFIFDRVNLHDVGNIKGTLASSGKFFGNLGALHAEATSETPDFAVDGGHPTRVVGRINCTVNAINGDTNFESIEARIGRTVLSAKGATEGSPKATELDLAVKGGRAEDVMQPFLHNEVPIIGPVSLHAHAHLGPSSEGRFFHRLRVDGAFDVPAERATNRNVEKSLTDFSRRAQGKDVPDRPKDDPRAAVEDDALSSISGPASIRDEVVTTKGLTFQLPGAEANLQGTFAIHTCAVHLTGDLKMHSDISHAATGFKSLLLKPLAPFFKKKNAGAVVPIAVIGTPGQYKVGADFGHKN
jgi:AsmA-like C-terminal region